MTAGTTLDVEKAFKAIAMILSSRENAPKVILTEVRKKTEEEQEKAEKSA